MTNGNTIDNTTWSFSRGIPSQDIGKPPEPDISEEAGISPDQPSQMGDPLDETPDGIIMRSLGAISEKVYPALRPFMAVPGYASAEIQALYESTEEKGIVSGLIKPAIPFLGGDIGQRRKEILGVDEEAGIREQLSAGIEFQENRDSLFWGEKFITEVAFDPLSYVGVGWIGKGAKLGVAGLTGTKAVTKVPASELARRTAALDTQKLINFPDEADLIVEGYEPNKMRRLFQEVHRTVPGKLPLLRQAIIALNPSGLIDASSAVAAGEKAKRIALTKGKTTEKIDPSEVKPFIALITTNHARTLEYAGSSITAALAPIRVATAHALKDRLIHKSNDVWMEVYDKKELTLREVPMGDVIQNIGDRYKILPTKNNIAYAATEGEIRQVFAQGNKLLDDIVDTMKKEGVDIDEILIDTATGEGHYWPRFIAALKNTEAVRSPTGGRSMGGKATFMMTRLNELQEESLQNGARFLGLGAADPYSDILELYLQGAAKQIADKRLLTHIGDMGITVSNNIKKELAESIKASRRRLSISRRASAVITSIVNGGNPRKAFSHISRVSEPVGRKFSDATRIVDPTERIRKLGEVEKEIDNMLSDTLAKHQELIMAKKQALARQLNIPGMRRVANPKLSGRLYVKEVADHIDKILGPENVNSLLRSASTVSGIVRLGSLTLDWGFPMLQGAMILMSAPRSWVKSSMNSLKALALPQTRWAYLAKAENQEILRVFGGRLQIGSQEFLEALRGGTIAKRSPVARKILSEHDKVRTVLNSTVDQTFGRFGASFEVFFDVARIEMAKGLMPAIRSGQVGVAEAASHINKMSGIISSRALGVGATQRELEATALFLAPRWMRAVTGLAGMAVQGGWQGEQAYMALTRLFAGSVALYAGLATLFKKPIKLDPRDKADGGDGAEFMTLEMGGAHIGLGGKPLSMTRLLFRMRANPADAIDYLKRWLQTQAAPLTGAGVEMFNGETYMGDQLKTPEGSWDLSEIAKQEGGRVLPFWAQALMEDPRPSPLGTAGEVLGLRSWPLPVYERRDDLRDELAEMIPVDSLMKDQKQRMLDEGLDAPIWDILTPSQKLRIQNGRTNIPTIDERHGELDRLEKRSKEEANKSGDTNITDYFDDINDNVSTLEDSAMMLARSAYNGTSSPADFLKNMQGHLSHYGATSDRIYDKDGEHALAIKELDEIATREERGGRFISIEEQARQDYITSIIAADDLIDDAGDYLYRKAEERINELSIKWGSDVIRNVEETFQYNKDMPELYRNWISDRDEIRAYWEVKENYIRSIPGLRPLVAAWESAEKNLNYTAKERLKRHPLIRQMNSVTSQQKRILRSRNPRLDALLYFWGKTDTVLTQQALTILEDLISKRLRGQVEEPVASLTT